MMTSPTTQADAVRRYGSQDREPLNGPLSATSPCDELLTWR